MAMTLPWRDQSVRDGRLCRQHIAWQQRVRTHVVHGVAAAEAAYVASSVCAAAVLCAKVAVNKFHGSG